VPSLLCSLEAFSDGDNCAYVLSLCFALGLIGYGQLIKIREKGRVVGKEKIVVYGVFRGVCFGEVRLFRRGVGFKRRIVGDFKGYLMF